MTPFPFEESDKRLGQKLIDEKKIVDLLFSEGTTQIEVVDEQSFWPFIQVDDDGRVKDHFCTCEKAEKTGSCPHLAAGYLTLFKNGGQPLHVRFRTSLINKLCQMASRRHGYDEGTLVQKSPLLFESHSLTGKILFRIEVKDQKILAPFTSHRPIETEETSLKFSNLSLEELVLYRKGTPSEKLQYELSFWSDLAKFLFLRMEFDKDYKIYFKGDSLPNEVILTFANCRLFFYIAKVNWPDLIPTLRSVCSPLTVREFQKREIEEILFDEKQQKFFIQSRSISSSEKIPEGEGIEVGDYLFFKQIGFFSKSTGAFLRQKEIPKEQIHEFLTKHAPLIQHHLQGTELNLNKQKARYYLNIDREGNLNIHLYLFEKGDLERDYADLFGPFAYLPQRGFYLIEGLLFEEKSRTIQKEKVGDFVTRHRLWLSEHEGFETHLLGIESKIKFSVSEKGVLHFKSEQMLLGEEGSIIDYGDWLYVKGSGFYTKVTSKRVPFLASSLKLAKEEVDAFITTHREDLDQVEGFFTPLQVVEKTGLKITLDDEMCVMIQPLITFLPDFQKRPLQLFGDYVYVLNHGFSEIPSNLKLPLDFRVERRVEKRALIDFLFQDLPRLDPYITDIDSRLKRPERLRLKLLQLTKGKKEGEWFLDLAYASTHGELDFYTLFEAIYSKQKFLFSDAGLINLLDPRFHWIKSLLKKNFSKDRKRLKLSTLEWLRLQAFESIQKPAARNQADKRTLKRLHEISSLKTSEEPDLTGLKSTLRPYQLIGVKWLFSIYTYGLSALLCDEMGLGKTHQAMALIASCLNRKKGYKILVVCPTSVIYHWEDLLMRFLPSAKTLIYYGVGRSLQKRDAEIIVTSYGTARSEKKPFKDYKFELAIFDEIQTAKNKNSKTYKALRSVDAHVRLGLTGTPIENNLFELKALFDLVLPTYFPSDAAFKELFVSPIEKNFDSDKRQLLSRLIHPFMLRRRKEDVLKELPECIEEVAYCDLSNDQRREYNAAIKALSRKILPELNDRKEPVPYLHIFTLLTKLKQICDHPALINKEPEKADEYQSGKWDLYSELLTEALESGQKVVVFSQFLDMIKIIENDLKKRGIGYASIKGATRDRKNELTRFKNDPDCRVFVGSLQAAGTGIDLISASIVIHYDRWWNPAKEEQATARVHRMGQKRGVLVFKLVTKKSIEEHIHALIEKKRALHEIVHFDDQESLKSLNRDELISLLSEVQENLS
ncbi:MAG: DEAD/DEAH box helicase [Simkaniaceae bacterium]